MNTIAVFIATGFGLGRSPYAPGTVGCLLGVGLVAVMAYVPMGWQIALDVFMVAAAIPICGIAEDHFQRIDDRRIVADEFLTFPICMLGLPWLRHWWLLPLGFVVNRVLDIVKPPPARQAQSLYGGLGIVLDDVVSSLYALLANHLVFGLVKGWTA